MHGVFVGFPAYQIAGDVLDRGEVGGRMIAADSAFVVTEHHVHHPVMALDAPVATDRVALLLGVGFLSQSIWSSAVMARLSMRP